MAKLKLRGEAAAFFKKIGRQGGRERAKKYSKTLRTKWATLGGRPARPLAEIEEQLRTIAKSKQAIRQEASERRIEKFRKFIEESLDLANVELGVADERRKPKIRRHVRSLQNKIESFIAKENAQLAASREKDSQRIARKVSRIREKRARYRALQNKVSKELAA